MFQSFFLCIFLSFGASAVELSQIKVDGHFQLRSEFRNNSGYQGAVDRMTFFRLRSNFYFFPDSKTTLKLSPQVTRILGRDEVIATQDNDTSTTVGTVGTSGSTQHPSISVYEAYGEYRFNDDFRLRVGREALAYGDHLVIGSLPWANNARSFDVVKFTSFYGSGWLDIFSSTLSDNLSGIQDDDIVLYGIYKRFSLSERTSNLLKEVDLYHFLRTNRQITGADKEELKATGIRLVSGQKPLFYRFEYTAQSGREVGLNGDAEQADLELGYNLNKTYIGLHYLTAGKNYDQLYPTAHKFLGYMDLLGRRNINAVSLHVRYLLSESTNIKFDYHQFQRKDTGTTAFALNGSTSFPTSFTNTNSSSADVGSEVDLVLTHKFHKSSKVQLGFTHFTPGAYLKESGNTVNSSDPNSGGYGSAATFAYIQLQTIF